MTNDPIAMTNDQLRRVLQPGDRIMALKGDCGARPRNYIFAAWDGNWIVSSSGISSIIPSTVTMINGHAVTDLCPVPCINDQ